MEVTEDSKQNKTNINMIFLKSLFLNGVCSFMFRVIIINKKLNNVYSQFYFTKLKLADNQTVLSSWKIF